MKTFLKNFCLASLSIIIFFAHIILQSPKVPTISHPCYNYKRVTNRQEGEGALTELDVKEIAKFPQEVTENIVDFSQCREVRIQLKYR